jgi:hypothetical protein
MQPFGNMLAQRRQHLLLRLVLGTATELATSESAIFPNSPPPRAFSYNFGESADARASLIVHSSSTFRDRAGVISECSGDGCNSCRFECEPLELEIVVRPSSDVGTLVPKPLSSRSELFSIDVDCRIRGIFRTLPSPNKTAPFGGH